MATIRKSKVGKYTYWQIVESKRVNGKPRPVVLAHLGTAEQLLYKLSKGPLEQKVRSVSHGAVEILYKTAESLELPEIFEHCFSAQKRDGLNVGQSLLAAALHRAISPGSKRAFADWAIGTSLPEFISCKPKKMDSQHFWDQMEVVTDEQLAEAEKRITLKLIEKGLFSPRLLFYDLTNFFTYIASGNKRNETAKRGHNKQKRHDLRQFGLAQVVTKDFLLPVFSEIYEGNRTDKELFIPFLTRLRVKLAELTLSLEEITIVFDKGSNSKRNFKELDGNEINYVASLSSAHHPELLKVPLESYREVDLDGQVLPCYRTSCEVWGKDRTVVLYFSEKLRQGQVRGLIQSLEKKYMLLRDLKYKLNNPRARKKQQETLQVKLNEILKGEYGPELINVRLIDQGNGRFDIEWELDHRVYQNITDEVFGKKILVTSQNNWSEKEIVNAYFGQSNVERVFKHLKSPYHNSVRPQYHWTDQKIKVHTFICLTGLLLSQLLWKKTKELDYKYSIETVIDKLTSIRKVDIVSLTGLKGKPARVTQLEEMDPDLEKLYQALLESY